MSPASTLRLAGAALFLAAGYTPAVAQQNQTARSADAATDSGGAVPQAAAQPATPDVPPLICRKVGASESRMRSQKVCLTKEQWRKAQF